MNKKRPLTKEEKNQLYDIGFSLIRMSSSDNPLYDVVTTIGADNILLSRITDKLNNELLTYYAKESDNKEKLRLSNN